MNAGSSIYTARADADWLCVTPPSGLRPGQPQALLVDERPLLSMELFAAESDNPAASTQVAGSEGDLEAARARRVLPARARGRQRQHPISGHDHGLRRATTPARHPRRSGSAAASLCAHGDTEGAHHNAGESACGGSRAGDVQYFVQVPEGGGIVRFELETLANEQGRRYDHLISLNRLCGEASELLCDDDLQSNHNDRIEAQLDAGIYTLTVDTLSSFSGGSPFRLTASIGAVDERLPLIAPGDGCSANIPTLPLPDNERGTIRVASTSEGLSDSARELRIHHRGSRRVSSPLS